MKVLIKTLFITFFNILLINSFAQEISVERGKQLTSSLCVACHGVDGNSSISPIYPKLAAQHAEYLVKQMEDFKVDSNGHSKRKNEIMNPQMVPLSESDIKSIALYYESQKMKHALGTDSSNRLIAEKLYRGGDPNRGLAACASCHGPAGGGIPGQYPRIAGQFPGYIKSVLKNFRVESRTNDNEAMMRTISMHLTDKEVEALGEYIAGLRFVSPIK